MTRATLYNSIVKTAKLRLFPSRKELILAVVILLLLLLSACGEAADTSGLSGSYILQSVSEDEVTLPDSLSLGADFRLRLDPDGSGIVTGKDAEGDLKWRFDNEQISVSIGSVLLDGFVDDGDLILQPHGSDLSLTFIRENSSLFENPPALEDSTNQVNYSADWYGWWKIEASQAAMPITWYDAFGSITLNDDGTYLCQLWDEDTSRSEPLGSVLFERTEYPYLTSINGYFLYESVSAGEWVITATDREILMENLTHHSNGEEFQFSVYLRPWGAEWDDLEETKRPFYYEDWYLPLINENASMPDSLPWNELEDAREAPVD